MTFRSTSALCSLALVLGATLAPVASVAAARPKIPATDRLYPGDRLQQGSRVFSESNVMRLELVGGTLDLRFGCGTVLWTAPASGVDSLVYSKRGLLKLEDAHGQVLLSVGTRQSAPRQLVVQNDGNVVARNATGWYFQTGTRIPPVSPVHPTTATAHC